MKTILTLSLVPIMILLDLYVFSWIGELLTQKSDVAVLIGVAGFSVLILLNYLFYKLLKKIK